MPINFPIPTFIGELFTAGGKTWEWNGYGWEAVTPTAVGATGSTGPQGATGIGATGDVGPQGATGLQGSTGIQGATGDLGGTGATGPQGATGGQGATGEIGSIGATGISGATGTQGATGNIGASGATGPDGATGATGATGAAGADGDRYHTTSNTALTIISTGTITLTTSDLNLDFSMAQDVVVAYSPTQYMNGEVVSYNQANGQLVVNVLSSAGSGTDLSPWEINLDGAVGIQGATGATGMQGATGDVGGTGATGIPGATGVQGATGDIGATGATGVGATGIQGATGNLGATGATGLQGATGTQGATGDVGPQGATGLQGSTGLQGATGDLGGTGATGIAGATGPAGIGITGSTGATGTEGATGLQGSTGATGVGATGATGSSGIQGSTGATGVGTTGSTGATGTSGSGGATGATGATGAVGQGVPVGGTINQVLAKTSSTNYATAWVNPATGDVTLTGTQTLTNKTIEAGTFTNGYIEETVTANTGAAYTILLTNGSLQILTLTASCTFTFPSPVSGQSFMLFLKQDGTGGRTATWPATVKWPSATAPTITSTANRTDKFVFTSDGTSWFGSNAGQNYN